MLSSLFGRVSHYRHVSCFFSQMLGGLFQLLMLAVLEPLPHARPGGEPCIPYDMYVLST